MDVKSAPLQAQGLNIAPESAVIGEASLIRPVAGEHPEGSEYFPGAVREEVGVVVMQDVVGAYADINHVLEWGWVEQAACFSGAANCKNGSMPFELVVSLQAEVGHRDVPASLQLVLAEARRKHLAYLIFTHTSVAH